MDWLRLDLKYAVRSLRRSPVFTAVAVCSLALGIGANTAIFSLTDQILLRSLPVKNPRELVVLRSPGPITGHASSDGDIAESFSYPMYKELRDRNNVFSGLLARFAVPLSVAGRGQTERASGELVSGNYFDVLGVRAVVGRTFTQDDDRTPGAHPVIVLSHGYWTRHMGADSSVLNQTLIVNGAVMTIVGVTQPGFTGVQVGQVTDIFVPITMKAQMTPNWDGLANHKDYWLAAIGRLQPGLSIAQAQEAIRPVYRGILEEVLPLMTGWPQETRQKYLDKRILMASGAGGRRILQRDAQAPLLMLSGMVGMVLLIACANVANLMIARSAARQREIAVRMALGAERWQLVRQLLVESLTVALLGGAVGLIVASWTSDALISATSSAVSVLGLSTGLDLRLLGFTLGLSILTGVLFGLAPAIRATRPNLEASLREQGAGGSESLSQVRFRKGLVVTQIALTAVLLVGAGLFARSLNNLKHTDLGLRMEHLITFSIAPELNGYSPQRTVDFFDRVREGVSSLPGVSSVSAAVEPVLTDSSSTSNVTVEGYERREGGEGDDKHAMENWVGPGHFSTMGIPLLAGRELSPSDGASSPKVAVVNEAFAKQFFSGRNAVGGHFTFGGSKVRPDIEIVGVVKDSKHTNVKDKPRPFVYIPYAQFKELGRITFYVRASQGELALAPSIRKEVQRLDANLPIFDMKTLEQQVSELLFPERLVTLLSLCFGLLAALLASIGLYGVMAYTVVRRTREIGIRMALGATSSSVHWLILREVLLMLVVGLIVGLPTALGLGRVAETMLFGVKPHDPLMLIAATFLLTCVALLAGYLPARKAAAIDPMVALRYE